MEQSFANENVISGNNETIEICMNYVVLENKFEENPSVQIETNRNLENGSEKLMKENLKTLHVRRKDWKSHDRTSLCCVNDNAEVDLINTQIMCCIYSNINNSNWNKSKNSSKEMIDFFNYKTNGITSLKIHVYADHFFIAQCLKKM
jgi:hypothetical protein